MGRARQNERTSGKPYIKHTIVRTTLELSGDPKVHRADRGEQSKLGCLARGFAVAHPVCDIKSAGLGWEPTDPREGRAFVLIRVFPAQG